MILNVPKLGFPVIVPHRLYGRPINYPRIDIMVIEGSTDSFFVTGAILLYESSDIPFATIYTV